MNTKADCGNTRLYDYRDSTGINIMQRWADEMLLSKKIRGRLDSKIDTLAIAGAEFPPGLVHPTKNKHYKHIFHLVFKGEVALRPMFCRGPVNPQEEFTFLFGAIEKDRKYVPKDTLARTEQNRQDLISNPQHRCEHERFGK